MAINNEQAIADALATLKTGGFDVTHELSVMPLIVKAVTDAILNQIKLNAQVQVTGGSSAGMYKIE